MTNPPTTSTLTDHPGESLLADSAVLHDLGHLLTLVTGFARLEELSCRESGGDLARATNLCAIRRAAERAQDLVADVAHHVRGGQAPMVRFDLGSLAEGLAEIFQGRGLPPLRLVGPPHLRILGHRRALERAILNLLWNAYAAIDQTRPGSETVDDAASAVSSNPGEVEMRWGFDSAVGGAWLEVADRGPGLPESMIGDLTPRLAGKALRPAAELREGASGRGSGSGIGLALAAEVMRQHGGRLLGRLRKGGGAVLRLELDGVE